ncbi:MAG: transposase [Candidatus Brocadiia bacterium]
MTVVVDYGTGRVVWMGQGRSKDTLVAFFEGMTHEQKQALEAVAIDMHAPYIRAIQKAVPQANIVFDLYHVMAAYGRLIDRVRRREYRKASAQQKEVFKGARYLLLKRRLRRRKEREHLRALLELNETIFRAYVLRDMLRKIWAYRHRLWAARALIEWCRLARAVGHPESLRLPDRHQPSGGSQQQDQGHQAPGLRLTGRPLLRAEGQASIRPASQVTFSEMNLRNHILWESLALKGGSSDTENHPIPSLEEWKVTMEISWACVFHLNCLWMCPYRRSC